MPERISRAVFALEVGALVLPSLVYVLPFACGAAAMLIPMGLYGLALTIGDSPEQSGDFAGMAEVLGMGVLGLGTLVALWYGLQLAGHFLLRGRAGLGGARALLRPCLLWGLPPLALSALPKLLDPAFRAADWNHRTGALVASGVLLAVPLAHLVAEGLRRPRPG